MSIYLDKLANVQVIINCRYSIAQMCTRKDPLTHILGMPFIDDIMRYNTLISVALNLPNLLKKSDAIFPISIISVML